MIKELLVKCKLNKGVHQITMIFCLFILSGCGGAGPSGSEEVSGYDSSGVNAMWDDEIDGSESSGFSTADSNVVNEMNSGEIGEVNNDEVDIDEVDIVETVSSLEDSLLDSIETIPVDFVELSWTAPVSDAGGSPLTDLGGYMIYYRKNDLDSNIESIDVGDVEYATINDLSSGTWCFVVTAYNRSGRESNFSDYACKDI